MTITAFNQIQPILLVIDSKLENKKISNNPDRIENLHYYFYQLNKSITDYMEYNSIPVIYDYDKSLDDINDMDTLANYLIDINDYLLQIAHTFGSDKIDKSLNYLNTIISEFQLFWN